MTILASKKLLSLYTDNRIRLFSENNDVVMCKQLDQRPVSICPIDMLDGSDGFIVSFENKVTICSFEKDCVELLTHSTNYSITSISVCSVRKEMALGSNNGKVYIFKIVFNNNGIEFFQDNLISANCETVVAISFSGDGRHIVMGDCSGRIKVYDTSTYTCIRECLFSHHSRITDLSWCPGSDYFASSSLDGYIIVWDIQTRSKIAEIPNADREITNGIEFVDRENILSCGGDSGIKIWNIKLQ